MIEAMNSDTAILHKRGF